MHDTSITRQGPTHTAIPKIWVLRVAAVVATIALLAVSAPLIWAAAAGTAGLLVLALAGMALFQAIPLGLQRLENRLLKMRKTEARANPIEQLQNDCLRREERLQTFRAALVTIGAQIESLGQMVADRGQAAPGQVLERQNRALQRMAHFYECNLRRLEEARAALENFRDQVKHKMFEWEFAQAGQVVRAALNPREMEDLTQDLLTDEALRSVQLRFNTVFAELDVEMRSIDSPARALMSGSPMERLDGLDLPTTKTYRRPS